MIAWKNWSRHARQGGNSARPCRSPLAAATDEPRQAGRNLCPPAGRQSCTDHRTLEYSSPFQLLIAVLLSAQATDVSVNKATRRLFADAPTPAAMAALGRSGWPTTSRPSASFVPRRRTPSPPATSFVTAWRRGATLREALEALPGVAARLQTSCSTPPSANRRSPSIRTSSAFPTAPGWRRKDPACGRAEAAENGSGEQYWRDAHHWLILHGGTALPAATANSPTSLSTATAV